MPARFPSSGLGIAIKIDDGAGRAAETVIAAVLDTLELLDEEPCRRSAILRAPVLNTRGDVVGERRPSSALADLRAGLILSNSSDGDGRIVLVALGRRDIRHDRRDRAACR